MWALSGIALWYSPQRHTLGKIGIGSSLTYFWKKRIVWMRIIQHVLSPSVIPSFTACMIRNFSSREIPNHTCMTKHKFPIKRGDRGWPFTLWGNIGTITSTLHHLNWLRWLFFDDYPTLYHTDGLLKFTCWKSPSCVWMKSSGNSVGLRRFKAERNVFLWMLNVLRSNTPVTYSISIRNKIIVYKNVSGLWTVHVSQYQYLVRAMIKFSGPMAMYNFMPWSFKLLPRQMVYFYLKLGWLNTDWMSRNSTGIMVSNGGYKTLGYIYSNYNYLHADFRHSKQSILAAFFEWPNLSA